MRIILVHAAALTTTTSSYQRRNKKDIFKIRLLFLNQLVVLNRNVAKVLTSLLHHPRNWCRHEGAGWWQYCSVKRCHAWWISVGIERPKVSAAISIDLDLSIWLLTIMLSMFILSILVTQFFRLIYITCCSLNRVRKTLFLLASWFNFDDEKVTAYGIDHNTHKFWFKHNKFACWVIIGDRETFSSHDLNCSWPIERTYANIECITCHYSPFLFVRAGARNFSEPTKKIRRGCEWFAGGSSSILRHFIKQSDSRLRTAYH